MFSLPNSSPDPPRYVEKRTLPSGSSLVTNASSVPPSVGSVAFAIGKSAEYVVPKTEANPIGSTVSAVPWSAPPPPRYVEYWRVPPSGLSFETNASEGPPDRVRENAPGVVGKSADVVSPVT